MLLKKDVTLSFGTDVVPAVLDLSNLGCYKRRIYNNDITTGKYRPRYSPKQFFGVTVETTV